jgi:hypothetical protein
VNILNITIPERLDALLGQWAYPSPDHDVRIKTIDKKWTAEEFGKFEDDTHELLTRLLPKLFDKLQVYIDLWSGENLQGWRKKLIEKIPPTEEKTGASNLRR